MESETNPALETALEGIKGFPENSKRRQLESGKGLVILLERFIQQNEQSTEPAMVKMVAEKRAELAATQSQIETLRQELENK